MSDFSWEEIYRRRAALAGKIGEEIGIEFRFDVQDRFHAYDLIDQNLANQPMWRVPFYVIAQRMKEVSKHHHVIDHAWWLLAADRTNEPWGFVTEPYMDPTEAEKLAAILDRAHEEWGIKVRVWPVEQSPWLPGRTVPIVTTAGVNRLFDFLKHGVGSALIEMRERYWA